MAKKKTTNQQPTAADGAPPDEGSVHISIRPPNFGHLSVLITGTAPYVQNRFGHKAREQMHAAQEAGSQRNKQRGKRDAKDFKACYEDAKHVTQDGWCGIPAASFRNAMISACRLCGFKMTHAKLAVFIEADGFGTDGTPLVRITKGKPEYYEAPVRNATGVCDLRARPMWREGWQSVLRIRYDADVFSPDDVINLLERAGQQVGIGEGRADSRKSCGLDFGFFTVTKR